MNPFSDVSPVLTRPSAMRWGAIIAGLLVAIICGVMLNLLGMGLWGLVAPITPDSLTAIGISVLIWYTLSGMVSMYLGGWTAGFFSHTTQRTESFLYGALTWSLTLLLALMMATYSAGAIVSMATGSVGLFSRQTFSLLSGPIVRQIAESDTDVLDTIRRQAKDLFDQSVAEFREESEREHGAAGAKEYSPEVIKRKAQGALKKVAANNAQLEFMQATVNWLKAENEQAQKQAKQKVIDLLSKNTQLSREDAEKVVQDWLNYYEGMKKMALEQLDNTKHQARLALEKSRFFALGLFVVLILGCVSAAAGSLAGARMQITDASNSPSNTVRR